MNVGDLFSIITIIIILLISDLNAEMQIYISRISQCKGKHNLSVVFHNFNIQQKTKNIYYISGTVIFKEDFPSGFSVTIDVRKCRNDLQTTNCDPFIVNLSGRNLCQLINEKSDIYTPAVELLQPPLTCPIKSGNYTLTDMKLNNALLRYLPATGVTFWESNLKGNILERKIACVDISIRVRPLRTRSRSWTKIIKKKQLTNFFI